MKKERGSERQKSLHRKVRTSKVFFKEDQSVERSERQKSECQKECRKCKNDFRRADLS